MAIEAGVKLKGKETACNCLDLEPDRKPVNELKVRKKGHMRYVCLWVSGTDYLDKDKVERLVVEEKEAGNWWEELVDDGGSDLGGQRWTRTQPFVLDL